MSRTSIHRLRLPLVAGACVILIAIWTAIAYQLQHLRGEAIDSARRHGENITAVVGEHFLLFAGSIEGTLRHLRAQWVRNPHRFADSVKEQVALPDNLLDQVAITDARGLLLYPASRDPAVSVGDRDYFAALKQSTSDTLHIGTPIRGRITGKIGIPFAVAMRGSSGGFRGVVVALIAADGLIRSYKAIDLGPSGFITLRHVDGTVVVRSTDIETMLGGRRTEWLNLKDVPETSGTYVRRSPTDGIERVLSFRKLPAYPFVVVAGQELDSALARYYEQRRTYLAGGALLSLILMLLVAVTRGKLKRVEQAEKDLRESENRYRTLTGLSADWYWELDQDCRFVALTPNTEWARARSQQADSHLGKRPWEMPYADPAGPDWRRCRALLEARQPFRDVVLRAAGGGGLTAYLNVRGHPVYDGAGAFKGFRGITKDVTLKRHAERLLELEHTVNRSLAGAEDTATALTAVIRDICETEGWECGRFWQVDEEAGVLRFAEGWGIPEEPIRQFLEQSRGVVFAPGDGMAGSVWQSREPLCVADIDQDPRAAHASLARRFGIHGAFVFPATSGGKVIGVFGFASNRVREPDERLLQAARVIGGQIGQFVQRKQAEEVLRQSEERFRSLLELSSDMYWEQDDRFRFTSFSGIGAKWPQERHRQRIGKRRWEQDYVNMSADDWAAHKAILEAHRPFHDLELCRVDESGTKSWTSVSGQPVFDASGAFRGYRGVGKDITARKREEQLRVLEHAVNRDLADADDVHECLKAVIRTVCESEAWDCGRYFAVDEREHVLRFGAAWGVAEPAIQRFVEAARNLVFRPEDGLSGCAWESGRALWSTDVTKDPRSLTVQGKTGIASALGIHGTFVFPVVAEGKTIGVLNFSSRHAREPEERLLQAIHVIGGQIGQFVRRKQAEQVLRESEAQFRNLTELSSDVYWEQDAQYRFTRLSGSGSQLVSAARSRLLGKTRWQQDYTNMTPEDWAAHIAFLDARKPFRDLELCRADESGKKVWVSVSGEPIFDDSGAFGGYRGVGKDITARKRAEELRALEHAVNRRLTEADSTSAALQAVIRVVCEVGDWDCGRYFRVDESVGVLRFSEAWGVADLAIAGFIEASRDLVYRPGVGLSGLAWQSGQPQWSADVTKDRRALSGSSASGPAVAIGVHAALVFPIVSDGKTIGVLTFASRRGREPESQMLQTLGAIGGQIGQFVQRKEGEERLAYLAQFDSLTGLPNRHLFRDRLMQAMARAKRTGSAMAVLFIDLDRFKLINDTLGHSAGDRLLKEATQRLQSCVRSSDTVGRFGGDEFGAIITDLAKPADASLVAQKIIGVLAQPFHLDGHESYVTASIGITLFPADGEEAGTLIMNADAAMYRAKEQGRNTYQYFTREMNERAMQRVKMETALRRAIERKEFLLHYQPKVKIVSGEVCGFEALLRWQHPEHGLVPPLEFIPVLEDTGLIVPVGEWVIGDVCAQIKRWQASGFSVPPVAVNLSARQFQQKGLEETVRRVLRESGIDPGLLHFELTESLLMKEPEVAARTLRGLKELGVMLSVDDFGTGYSSLSYLKRFPIDALKIDRAFIRDVTVDPDDAAITFAIIGLAHSLKLNVIAEGVETRDQLHFLETHGCDEMQGFLFSRPVPAEECARMLRERRRLGGARRRAAGASGAGERRLRAQGGRG